MDINDVLSNMTLEEKASFCSGSDCWHTQGIPRLGVPALMFCDGPHGLRKQDILADKDDINNSIKAVCFPTGSLMACSFDRQAMRDLGEVLGEECNAENISILLGPAINIKRSPLCGRNFEYLSEDPYLTGQLGSHYIHGVQKKNVGVALKHFAANNQEYRRLTSSSNMSERTLREIYLSAFEECVKTTRPWSIMCSYNLLNGEQVSENKYLLTDILRNEWGYRGFVMSDWTAVRNRPKGIEAGLDLEMPGNQGMNDGEIIKAVQSGELSMEALDKSVLRILEFINNYTVRKLPGKFDKKAHHEEARRLASESIVLLKNDQQVLPLREGMDGITFIGEFAEKPRYQGGGSSHILSEKVTSAMKAAIKYELIGYSRGYDSTNDEKNERLFNQAVMSAKSASAVVVFAGLPDSYESEGYDRKHMRLPKIQNALIDAICEVNKKVIVVLHHGSPVEMPWIDKVSAVVDVYLGGDAIGGATADVLFGKVNPSGRLPETYPLRLEDTPSYLNFPGDGKNVDYAEGIFVGYRYYDKKKLDVLFPFGYGLSYTTFEYSNLVLDKKEMKDNEILQVSVDVTNTGALPGKEVVQLYVADLAQPMSKPIRELKEFAKIYLEPNETKTITMQLNKRSFAWYNEEISDWYVNDGLYDVQIGKSSREIILKKHIQVNSTTEIPLIVDETTTISDLLKNPRTQALVFERFVKNSAIFKTRSEAITAKMIENMLDGNPLYALRNNGEITNDELRELIIELNDLLTRKM